MRKIAIAMVVLVALIATNRPSAAQSGDGLSEARARELIDEVFPRVERLRGRAFERPVPVELVDSATARDYMVRRIESFQAAGELAALGRVYSILGLIPDGMDLFESLLDTLSDEAGAYYDPESGGIYVMRDLVPMAAPVVTAHELTHALDDQHFDLDARLRAPRHNEDRIFALSAIHEGSATLLMGAFIRERVAAGLADERELRALDPEHLARAFPDVPEILLRQLIGPYLLGAEFLAAPGADEASGFPGARVDRAYVDPPRSSEQILHPAKYWDPAERDEPRPLDNGDAGRLLGDGWARSEWGRLGELGLAVLVGATTPRKADPSRGFGGSWTHPAAAGWGGDRWELWVRGEDAAVLLCTVWDSPEDAVEFARALPPERGIHSRVTGDAVALVAGDVRDKTVRRLLERMRTSCAVTVESVE